jgi:hypothetical protein
VIALLDYNRQQEGEMKSSEIDVIPHWEWGKLALGIRVRHGRAIAKIADRARIRKEQIVAS